ncbi:hypothetical protein HNY73_011213 [Argiope bruennichi]|uniref:Uncharacterized protein n=1 Tax=Argiope bruennichi TaxID=94029 RepID=A0A8T0F8H0_ARGBR|nr:hypothetical protein HNY73_011213 [Argiope bruennichi]
MSSKTSDFQDKVENQEGNGDDDGEATRTSSSLSDGTISNSTSSYPSSTAEVRSKGPTLRRSVLFLHNLILQTKNSDGEMKVENQEEEAGAEITLTKSPCSLYNFVTDMKPSDQQDEAQNKEGKSEKDQEGSPPCTGNADNEGKE